MYGGGAAGGGGGMNDMMGGGDAGPQVRQADSGVMEQMVGGPEPNDIYQNMRRQPHRQQQQNSNAIMEDWDNM